MDGASSFRFSRIYVIESLRSGDRQTGTDLYEDVLLPATWRHNWLSTRLLRPADQAGLLRALNQVAVECKADNAGPVLHFETHGSRDGLELQSGEIVSWQDLWHPLASLNAMCRLNLLVVVAACHGASIFRTIQPTEPAPFWGLLGPRQEMTGLELFVGFRTFYQRLLDDPDGRAALFQMNSGHELSQWPFIFSDVHFVFRTICQSYLDTQATPAVEAHRVEKLVNLAVARDHPPPEVIPRIRSFFAAAVSDHHGALEQMRRRFFMIDMDPTNDRRFAVDFSKLLDL